MKNNKITVFKDLYKSKDVPYIISLEKILDRIKKGNDKELINKIRKSNNKDDKSKLKAKLPAILFQGEFTHRAIAGLIKSSKLMVLDFDGIETKEELKNTFNLLKDNKHILSVFISPSGLGLKALLVIAELDSINYTKVFKTFKREFNYNYFDIVTSDISRVCFSSYDPNIYINYNAEVYNPIIIDEGYEVVNKQPLIPIYNEDIIVSKIMKFNFTKDFVEGERNAFVFDIAGLFCEYGVSERYALGYILNNIVHGNFTERETDFAVKSAYNKRQFNSKFFEDYNLIQNIKKDVGQGKKIVIDKYNIDEKTFNKISTDIDVVDFWDITEDRNGKEKVVINPSKFKLFLEMNGFKKYFPNESLKPMFVRIISNKVNETSVEVVKDFVLDYLTEKKEHNVWNYCAGNFKIFTENYLLMLESVDLMMLKDLKDKSFIAYKNGILEVTKDKINLIDYLDVEGYIWESQIIKREFSLNKNLTNDYKLFINNISNNDSLPVECVIGYLLSNYKNKMNNKAIILNDEVITDNPEGGTGKGLFIQGLKQIRKVSILDGKSFDDKKSFPYQTVKQETNILVFDDVKKNFDFESKFSLVTEGMTLERKNKDAIKLRVEESPKMVISTNYAIKGEGNSHDRRRHEIEFAQYYGKEVTPYTEFKRQLFDDWNDNEYNQFDNYMVNCLQTYLSLGLVKQNAKNIKLRKLIAETSMEFVEWAKDVDNLPLDTRHDKKLLFERFTEEYIDFKKYLTRKRFNIWIQKFANFNNLAYTDGNSNGLRWLHIELK
jgi:hypothetical protein